MNKLEKSQILMLSLLAILLIIAPLLSLSLRSPYLYIITNLLIIALRAQAGLLSDIPKPSDHARENGTVSAAHKHVIASELPSPDKRVLAIYDEDQRVASKCAEKKPKVIEKSISRKICGIVKIIKTLKKCPSMPSLFFIGGGEADEGDHDQVIDQVNHEVKEEEAEVGELSGQELFTKAETFIGNFYKQLKMQREESWNKIHGF